MKVFLEVVAGVITAGVVVMAVLVPVYALAALCKYVRRDR